MRSYQPDHYNEPWIQTFTGVPFTVLNPKVEQINHEDIAHALSNLCRFAGHTKRFYSVAQHSILVSYNVPPEMALEGLLHDATEAYLVDIPRPLKKSGQLGSYDAIEERLWCAIAAKYNLRIALPPQVKEADARALFTEQRDLLGPQAMPWDDRATPFAGTIYPLPPDAAKIQFIARFNQLTRERGTFVNYSVSRAA